MRRHEILTFDCYGTLVDWRGGILSAFEKATGRRLDAETLLALHAEIEPRVQAERFRSYREVLDETARRMARRLGLEVAAGNAAFLSRSLSRWRPFADTNPALRRLAEAGCVLGILSNVDDDLLAATRQQLAADFEIVVTAEQVGSYKPAPAHFETARELVGGRSWLHVAQSVFHDVVPAEELGIPVAWINRLGESAPAGRSPRQFTGLEALADWLLA